ncbi:CGNR zinc finger domain-containing protein [Streptomyces sp. NPDC051940]|uniref:CGNR zinc finger domain-containing protein n=1 Tax=Streptomyces sp. NPDC051940 TaxID=3155675 RepID=UPI003426F077
MDEESPYYLHHPVVPGEDRFASLGLVNTRFTVSHGTVDLLEDAEAAHLWLVRRALLPDPAPLAGRHLGRLLTLREALRGLFASREAHTAPAAGPLEVLNSALAAAPATPRLVWTAADGPRRDTDPDTGNPVAAALSALAEDSVELLAGPEGDQLAECGAPGCARWFLRSHGARRWCTTRCGNRVRAARAYAAKKGQ